MSDLPNKADFIADERPGEYEATFSVRGTIRVTIKAGSLEEARAKADAMTEDEEFGLELDEADDVSVNWVGRPLPMFLVTRDGKKMKVSRLQPGDLPRQPDERGF
ncbi:hypothetical protein [Sinorhizobium meliloti]|uniref:hypothetical protein n=1 Tax=Rhizobium meliloti TaxID=382 RepID=UPI000B4A006B|nr:hypothetical protein [Sinorhizobium meliloti]ASP63358.1 hypothetical protein CDO29_01290 [Sinorhizobium meliloti]MQX04123.1 hypothetical protein [Sinorhizobium meliloti]QPI24447.1 hypothetical protein I0J99_10815 [Sinorhizobium meliloti]RVK43882.1 hypothetical protein CN160_28190 [Sinorhizobium meliloti]RVM80500.1 hypothetical protein CN122_31965 [Sinorhizobium meliloti]